MKEVNLYKFYRFGEQLKLNTQIKTGEPQMETWAKLMFFGSWHLSVFTETQGIGLPKTREALAALRVHMSTVQTRLLDAIQRDENAPITVAENVRIGELVKTFETELEHESRELNVFSISDVGTHSTTKLLKHAHRNLPTAVCARLTNDVINDVDEAGRCLGFDRPTAAGFHILRAVEPLILDYHNKVTKKVLPKHSRSWSTYIIALRSPKHAGRADPKVLGMLEHIRDFYRNPIMHPEETLNLDDALSLFHTCLSAIVQLDAAIQACPP